MMNEAGVIGGELTPYLLSDDEWITGILIGCFVITACILSQGKILLLQSLRKLFSTHEIGHLFHKQPAIDSYFLTLLTLQTCLLVSILLLKFQSDGFVISTTERLTTSASSILLACYSLMTVLYCIAKRYIYKFINWIFFDKAKNNLWTDAYFFILSIFGMLLLPVTLLAIYGNLPFHLSIIIPVFLFFLMNLIFIYKCFSIFFSQLHGSFYLFLYFCTLEILPLLVVWKGIEMVNDIFL
ncbi:MAG: DUF4271 domain-containing protein [Bacteroidaceae bacterium]|nr:DUF4271 domain-containing protein [Bacteroidaceae bacterium]